MGISQLLWPPSHTGESFYRVEWLSHASLIWRIGIVVVVAFIDLVLMKPMTSDF